MKPTVASLIRRAVFSASHRLHASGLSAEENRSLFGQCNRESGHGHNYVLEVTVRGPIHPVTGMVMSLTELKKAIEEEVMAKVDHRHLNLDVPAFRELNPTAENIAKVIWGWLRPRVPADLSLTVLLRETENNSALFSGE